MKRLKILEKQSDFLTQYPDSIPSNDVVLVRENNKLYMATNNADGTYAEYGATGGGEITPEIIDELGLVTVDDISTFVKNGTVGNLYIGSDASTTGSSLVVVRQFQGQVSETKLSNVDNRSALVNRVGSIDNARLILSHEGLMVGYSGDKDTSFPAQSKHVAYIEDTSANFALKSEIDGFVDSQDISTFVTMSQVQSQGYLKQNNVSTFITMNDVQAEGYLKENNVSTFVTMAQVEGQGYLKENNVSTFITMPDVQAEGYLKQNNVSTFITMPDVQAEGYLKENNVSTFITMSQVQSQGYLKPNDVSNHALKSELEFLIWQGTEAQYEALANHTDFKIYLITE